MIAYDRLLVFLGPGTEPPTGSGTDPFFVIMMFIGWTFLIIIGIRASKLAKENEELKRELIKKVEELKYERRLNDKI